MSEPKQREKLVMTKEQALAILNQEEDEFADGFKIVRDEMVDKSRWSIHHELIIQRLSDGKFFAGGYSCGATEQQDESPWEYETPEFTEVFPVQKVITVYK